MSKLERFYLNRSEQEDEEEVGRQEGHRRAGKML